jgi:hypothetical protein
MADELLLRLQQEEAARRSRTERELEALGEGMVLGDDVPVVAAPVKKKKKKDAGIGVGTSSFNVEAAVRDIKAKIAATSDPSLQAKLLARIEALEQSAAE